MTVHDLHRLGKKVAGQLGEGPGEERIALQREAVADWMTAKPSPGPLWFRLPALAGAAGLVILIAGFAGWFWLSTPEKNGAPKEGMVLTARTTPLVMELPGGNTARLAPDSVGQLAASGPDGVRVVLIHGELTSSIRTPVSWSVQAGPYLVMAAGTEYVVRWQNEKLEVLVQTGRVRVLGEDAPKAGWLVEAGERMTIDRGRILEKTRAGAPATPPEAPGAQPGSAVGPGVNPVIAEAPVTTQPPPASPVPPAAPGTPRADRPDPASPQPPPLPQGMTPPTVTPTPPVPEWRSMLQKEEYAQAIALVEKAGLSQFADSATLTDLQAMANAARYAGRGQTAVVLLVSLRTRFPGTAPASTAAFLMGRVYSEQLKDHRAAVSWFSTYLAEVPSGSLVEEALGRKMDAAQRAGMAAEAKKTAALLVRQYPTSPFRQLANQILGNPN